MGNDGASLRKGRHAPVRETSLRLLAPLSFQKLLLLGEVPAQAEEGRSEVLVLRALGGDGGDGEERNGKLLGLRKQKEASAGAVKHETLRPPSCEVARRRRETKPRLSSR